MLPLNPHEEGTLKALSFWGHFHGKPGQWYVDRTRIIIKSNKQTLLNNGIAWNPQAITDDELVDLIKISVLRIDPIYGKYVAKKCGVPFAQWPIIEDSFARLMVSLAKGQILAGL